ncbi:MAG: hypothetical protein AMJ75_00640 [Phycisphaerae bacterium SM1_79]|nr:MAG: hypothetical protein AMJ75_00640 [Phycisphaerae bacterium SM1_79]
MATVFSDFDTVFFVGGRGTKAGDANAGGGAVKADWEGALGKNLADVMGSNGEPLSDSSAWNGSQTACNATEGGGGWLKIDRVGAFSNCKVGNIANVQFLATFTSGRYRVRSVGSDNIELDYVCGTGSTTCDVKVGGAFDKLQTALDNTDASATSPHNVTILTNKAETFSGAGDQIDVDTGGGSGSAGTWKRIIGVDDNGNDLVKGSYVLFDGNGQSCHIFKVLNVECIELRHIRAINTANTHYGFYVTATVYRQGFLLKDCNSTGCKYGLYSDTYYIRGVTITGGYYSSVTGAALCFSSSRWINVLNAEIVGSSAGALIDGDVVGVLLVEGCVLRKTGNYIGGVYTDNWDTFLIVRSCVFYNIDSCIRMNDAESRLVQYNNIFLLHTSSTGKIIERVSGSIKYSNHSCAWALDGIPSATGRWGGSGKPENAIEENPQFVDAANGDFRPRNPNVLRGGKPDIADNATEMGAVLQEHQFDRRAKAVNFGRLQIIR